VTDEPRLRSTVDEHRQLPISIHVVSTGGLTSSTSVPANPSRSEAPIELVRPPGPSVASNETTVLEVDTDLDEPVDRYRWAIDGERRTVQNTSTPHLEHRFGSAWDVLVNVTAQTASGPNVSQTFELDARDNDVPHLETWSYAVSVGDTGDAVRDRPGQRRPARRHLAVPWRDLGDRTAGKAHVRRGRRPRGHRRRRGRVRGPRRADGHLRGAPAGPRGRGRPTGVVERDGRRRVGLDARTGRLSRVRRGLHRRLAGGVDGAAASTPIRRH